MTFGSSTGPAAGHAQVKELQALLARAGYDDFRAARGPYQLTQRQGGGKFTREEADALLERLRTELGDQPDDPPAAAPRRAPTPTATPTPPKKPATLRTLPDAVLVGELERRGFTVIPPPS